MVDNGFSEIKDNILNDRDFLQKLNNSLEKVPTVWGEWSKVHLGKEVSVVNTLFNTSSGEIYIGDYTFMGHNVSVITGTHDIGKVGKERMLAVLQDRSINIGSGVWIGTGSIILGPCSIGDNAVIAAGTVVLPKTKIGDSELYAGVPAKRKRILNYVFEDSRKLLYGFYPEEKFGEDIFGSWSQSVHSKICQIKTKDKMIELHLISQFNESLITILVGNKEFQFMLNKGRNTIKIPVKRIRMNYFMIEFIYEKSWCPKAELGTEDDRVLGFFLEN